MYYTSPCDSDSRKYLVCCKTFLKQIAVGLSDIIFGSVQTLKPLRQFVISGYTNKT